MQKVTSKDETAIAYERLGEGEPLILVAGASCTHQVMHPLAERMAEGFTVVNPDRRGRGASGDTRPYAVEREVEDVAALIDEVGGEASLYGHSSGSAVVLYAAAAGLPVTGLILHDPPYVAGAAAEQEARTYGEELRSILAEGRNGDAMELFLNIVGTPQEVIDGMRSGPGWAGMEAIAPTLAYDSEAMGDVSRGGSFPPGVAAAAAAPALVLIGDASPPFMLETGRRLAEALPNGRFEVLAGADHSAPPEVVAPALESFLASVRSD